MSSYVSGSGVLSGHPTVDSLRISLSLVGVLVQDRIQDRGNGMT